MTKSHWQHHGRGPERSCDVAIIGAGVIGCATAYWVGRMHPSLDVVLIDGGEIASGASGRNAGFLLQGAQSDYVRDCAAFGSEIARHLWRFTRENRDMIFSELDGSAFALESTGSHIAAGSETEDDRLREAVALMRADGAAVTYFSAAETRKRLSSVGFLGSLYVPSGATLNPVAFVRYLAAHSGAETLEHAPVRTLEAVGGSVRIETDRRPIRSQNAVVALNAWLPQLLPEMGRFVRPVRAQMFSTQRSSSHWLNGPVYSHDGYYYVRQAPDGSVLVGGARHLHEPEEVGYADVTTDGVQRDIEAYLHTHFPQASGLEVVRRWSGVMGFSPDHLPVVGRVPEVPGAVWAAGFSGHGMGYAFHFGRLLAEMVIEERRPSALSLFSADRFGAGDTKARAS